MKTLKELADLGAAAALPELKKTTTLNWCMWINKTAAGDSWNNEEPARQAFAQAVKEAVEKPLRDEITVMGAKIEELETDLDDLESSRNEWMKKWKTNQVLLEKLVDKISAEPTSTTKTVPLDINDIRATDEFRHKGSHIIETAQFWHSDAVELSYGLPQRYADLADNYLRRQHGSDEWKPCTKEVTV